MASSPRSPSTTLTQNPLSLRLYKVLAANFDDDATKEALDTLAELYAPAPGPAAAAVNAKGKEVRRELEDDLDDEGFEDGEESVDKITSAQTPSFSEPVPGEIAANARKNLRRDVESKLAESSRRFLVAFAEVDKVCCGRCSCVFARPTMLQQLDTLSEHIGAMRARCDEAQTQLQTTNDACRSLLDRAGSLREQR